MKKLTNDPTRLRRPALSTLGPALLVLLSLAGCRDAASAPAAAERTAEQVQPPAAHHERHGPAPSAGEAAEHSVYHLPSTWLDQDGREIALDELGGRIQVVAMVYTHCSYACPRILAQMKRIEGEVADEAGADVGFTLVSIDPERDRPARLKEFAEKSRLDPARWTLLNGSERDILGLSVLLGVKYRATAEGEFAHSNVITILDRNGVVVDRVEGLGADLTPAVRTVRRLLRR